MDKYLKGFIEGFEKALELNGKHINPSITNREKIAKNIYQDITFLQEKEKRAKETFSTK